MLQSVFILFIWLITLYFTFNALYILCFSIASVGRYNPKKRNPTEPVKTAILFPVYAEDNIILDSIDAILNQKTTNNTVLTIVIADTLYPETISCLKEKEILVCETNDPDRTKAKALLKGLIFLETSCHPIDMVVVMDADNTTDKDFLTQITATFATGKKVIQGKRKGKPSATLLGVLDTFSAEINNNIFRKGQRKCRLSSSLAGSGMAFSFQVFKEMMRSINLSSCGEDKEMELYLLKNRIPIEYNEHAIIWDEKIEKSNAFISQRKRWLYAQWEALGTFGTGMMELIKRGNIDLFNKHLQMLLLPRILLLILGLLGASIACISMINQWIVIWTGILSGIVVALILAIPRELYQHISIKMIWMIPYTFVLMVCAFIGMNGASGKFLHTRHRGCD